MERDFDTFDPNEALVDEGRNLYYPAGWQKGDPVFVLNEDDPGADTLYNHEVMEGSSLVPVEPLYELEQRKGLDCE